MNYVYQFDMTAANIPASKTTVALYDGFASPFATNFYLSQLAPDGKIYIVCGNGTQDIHVINYPDSVGPGCDVCQHCIHLPAFNAFTIANHPNYFLGPLAGSVCDTVLAAAGLHTTGRQQLSVFPNPVNGNEEVTFTYPSSGEKAFLIINGIEGKEVMRVSLPQWSSVHHLQLPELSGGLYLARLVTAAGTAANVKFVVE